MLYNGNFSKEDFNKLSKEKDHLKAAWTQAIVEIVSLNHHMKTLEKI
jgi:hypothetical protein